MAEIRRKLKSVEAKLDTVLKQQSKIAEILKEQNMLLRKSLSLSSQSGKQILTEAENNGINVAKVEEEGEEEDRNLSLFTPARIQIPRKKMKGKKGRGTPSSSSSRQFPLKTEDDVDKLDEELKGPRKNEIVTLITQLLAGTIANIERILEAELVYNFNYDGTKGKIPLKSYTYFVAALYEATKKPESTHEYFVFDLRTTFRKLKNKYQKRLQKQRELDPLKSQVDDMDLSLFPDLSN